MQVYTAKLSNKPPTLRALLHFSVRGANEGYDLIWPVDTLHISFQK